MQFGHKMAGLFELKTLFGARDPAHAVGDAIPPRLVQSTIDLLIFELGVPVPLLAILSVY
jgi:hypothetical protein